MTIPIKTSKAPPFGDTRVGGSDPVGPRNDDDYVDFLHYAPEPVPTLVTSDDPTAVQATAMGDVFQIYECTACHEFAIVNGEKRDGLLIHGRSPGGTTRCGGILMHRNERRSEAKANEDHGVDHEVRAHDGHPKS